MQARHIKPSAGEISMKTFRVCLEVESFDEWTEETTANFLAGEHIKILSCQELKRGSHEVRA